MVTSCAYKLTPKSLFARFVLIIILPAIIAQSIVIYMFYERHWYSVTLHTSQLLTREISSVMAPLREGDLKLANSLSLRFRLKYKLVEQEQTQFDNGNKMREELHIFRKLLRYKLSNNAQVGMLHMPSRIWCSIPLGDQRQVVLFEMPLKPLVNPTTYIYILWIIGANIVLLAISLLFSRNQIRSILDLASATDQYGRGQKVDYRPSGATEIRMAGSAIIRMRDRIQKQLEKRTKMLAMISHDLRTPLTRLKLQLELLDGEIDKESQQDMRHDITNMEQMISSYLDFARAEGAEEFQEINLKRWLQGQIDQAKYPELQVTFSKCRQSVIYKLRVQAMQRVFNNILSNAQRYASELHISVSIHGNDIQIDFEDNGPGIPDSQKSLVFKTFYRSDASRHLDSSGNVGLGLAICSEIIQGHHGAITLHDGKKLNGLLIRITLPLEVK